MKLMLLMLLLTVFPFTHAAACEVAVCDIPGMVSEYRGKREIERYQFVMNLIQTNERQKNIPTLRNLIDVAQAMRALAIELKDEDYVARACDQLQGLATVNLSKVDAGDQERLFGYYLTLSNLDDRYRMLNHWANQAESLEDLPLLERLINLATRAIDLDKEWDGSRYEYVPNEGRRLIRLATERALDLDPFLEGVFDVTLKNYRDKEVAYRMVVLQPKMKGGGNGLDVIFVAKEQDGLTYSFSDVSYERDRTGIKGIANTPAHSGAPSALRFHVNRIDGTVAGKIRETRQATDLRFEGKAFRVIKDVAPGQPGPASSIVEGVYQGRVGNLEGRLILKQLTHLEWGATFEPKDGPFLMPMMRGVYIARTGTLTLLSHAMQARIGKIALGVESSGEKVSLKGFQYTTRLGEVQDATFEKIGPVDPWTENQLFNTLLQQLRTH